MLVQILARAVLLSFPKQIRDRVGRPLVQTLLTDCRTRRGRLAAGRFALGVVDVARAGLAERLAMGRRGVRRPRRSIFEALWQEGLILAGFTVALTGLAVVRFRKGLE